MRFRKLRIAWSVFWGLACVLLIALSVRSFYWRDSIYHDPPAKPDGQLPDIVGVISFHGNVILTQYIDPFSEAEGWGIANELLDDDIEIPATTLGFALRRDTDGVSVSIPYWLLIAVCGTLAVATWIDGGFSLRALLIVTTLIAVVLGLIVWISRAG
jgi:hypothetical protein